MAKPKTDTIQYIVLFSQRTVQLPSVELSQKHELLVWTPAPFFCTTTHVTRKQTEIGITSEIALIKRIGFISFMLKFVDNIFCTHSLDTFNECSNKIILTKGVARNLPIYLKGFCNLTNDCKQQSMIEDDHWLTLLCKYVFPPITDSMASLIAALQKWKILYLCLQYFNYSILFSEVKNIYCIEKGFVIFKMTNTKSFKVKKRKS